MTMRLIPRLDIKGPNLVKGIHFEGLRVLGKPETFARYYYEQGADELLYVDAVASLYGRNSLLDIVERTAREIFIPLTVGGGLRSVDDMRAVLRAGADKVAINTAAIANPSLISEAAQTFGSSVIVVSIQARERQAGIYECLTDYGRETTGLDVVKWASRAVDLGAGEILLTSVDREGTGKGLDLELIRRVAEVTPVPIIAAGGAGKPEHIVDAVNNGKADAVAVAAMLHYQAITSSQVATEAAREEGNTEFLQGGRGFGVLAPTSIGEVKRVLATHRIESRPLEMMSAA